jgi:hypothetical protein
VKHVFATAAALLLGSAAAMAQAGFDAVIEDLRRQGYGGFEIDRAADRIRVEAERGGERREFIYDARTGSLLSDESGGRDDDDEGGFGGRGGDDDRDDGGSGGRDDDDDDRAGGGDDDGDDGGGGDDDGD